ncbi:Gfo/Idh/MocA family protein [Paenibacillus sp. MAH-36]|uniref:Gfo/Idh/MocA family oxidoreductase n=1 Tax=Paenibacillus violae TaxID=3077234 RepID=A0ABU3R8Z9_9BACL|nr:Gfo/Idh/MocA family oxidoreductase [Paenibacillus sp. PFR10]MDU0200722.1 Gfo/Idh/MocA family oxidoreductase [Paenibacillus sp. PFR10]
MLKIAIAGTGWFAEKHASLLAAREDAQVVAFLGSSLPKAEKMAQKFAGAQAFDEIEMMLDTVKPDAVYISVPPIAHGSIEEAIVQRNIPFLIEKPIGLDMETVNRIQAQVNSRDIITSVGYHIRYTDTVQKAKELLETRKVGMAVGSWLGDMPGVHWWRKQNGSGGQFVEQTTHIVDLVRYLVGEVEEVYAVYAQRHMHTKHDGVEVADVGAVTLKLAGGAVASITNTCMLPFGHRSGLELFTDQGVLEIQQNRYLKNHESTQTTEYKNILNPYEIETDAFLHAIKTGDRSRILTDYADAAITLRITLAALESSVSGMPIKLR